MPEVLNSNLENAKQMALQFREELQSYEYMHSVAESWFSGTDETSRNNCAWIREC